MQYITTYPSPIGVLTLASDGHALIGVWFENQKYYGSCLEKNPVEKELEIFALTKKWLDRYFQGIEPDFEVPIKFIGTDFQKQVWKFLTEIPYGSFTTYGVLAKKLNTSPRAIGTAVGKNPISILVPCHRVIGKNLTLTGYAGTLSRKEYLLTLEHIDYKKDV